MTIAITYEIANALDKDGAHRTVVFIVQMTKRIFKGHDKPFYFRHYVASRQCITKRDAIEWGFNECIRRCN